MSKNIFFSEKKQTKIVEIISAPEVLLKELA
jgi:hypothetical protein